MDERRYVSEINAFYDWLLTHQLPAVCISLWHALWGLNYKSGFSHKIIVSEHLLRWKCGLTSRQVKNATEKLMAAGLIERRNLKNGLCLYRLTPCREVLKSELKMASSTVNGG